MLERLINAGIKYLFVSNSDNLGATLDLDLLGYFASTDKDFIMEVRTPVICSRRRGVSWKCIGNFYTLTASPRHVLLFVPELQHSVKVRNKALLLHHFGCHCTWDGLYCH
jgi:hypothetical protein